MKEEKKKDRGRDISSVGIYKRQNSGARSGERTEEKVRAGTTKEERGKSKACKFIRLFR